MYMHNKPEVGYMYRKQLSKHPPPQVRIPNMQEKGVGAQVVLLATEILPPFLYICTYSSGH